MNVLIFNHFMHILPVMILVIGIGCATYALKRILLKFLTATFTKARIDPIVQDLLYNTTKWFVYALGTILILENLGIKAGLLVSTFGITGLTIGLAVKDIVSNIAAGILILIYQPFSKGDYIKIKDFEGRVQSINIRHTKLEHDGFTVIIPNNILYSGAVAIKKNN